MHYIWFTGNFGYFLTLWSHVLPTTPQSFMLNFITWTFLINLCREWFISWLNASILSSLCVHLKLDWFWRYMLSPSLFELSAPCAFLVALDSVIVNAFLIYYRFTNNLLMFKLFLLSIWVYSFKTHFWFLSYCDHHNWEDEYRDKVKIWCVEFPLEGLICWCDVWKYYATSTLIYHMMYVIKKLNFSLWSYVEVN